MHKLIALMIALGGVSSAHASRHPMLDDSQRSQCVKRQIDDQLYEHAYITSQVDIHDIHESTFWSIAGGSNSYDFTFYAIGSKDEPYLVPFTGRITIDAFQGVRLPDKPVDQWPVECSFTVIYVWDHFGRRVFVDGPFTRLSPPARTSQTGA